MKTHGPRNTDLGTTPSKILVMSPLITLEESHIEWGSGADPLNSAPRQQAAGFFEFIPDLFKLLLI